MPDDDILVNDGDQYTNGVYYPPEDAAVKEAEIKQKAAQATSYPIMDDVADWFKEQIDECDSAQNIKAYALANGYTLEESLAAFDIAATLLRAKAAEFGEFGSNPS
jgi:hypothetical protein